MASDIWIPPRKCRPEFQLFLSFKFFIPGGFYCQIPADKTFCAIKIGIFPTVSLISRRFTQQSPKFFFYTIVEIRGKHSNGCGSWKNTRHSICECKQVKTLFPIWFCLFYAFLGVVELVTKETLSRVYHIALSLRILLVSL